MRSYWWGEQAQYTTLSKTYYGIRSDYGYLIGFQGDFRPSRSTPGWLHTIAAPARSGTALLSIWTTSGELLLCRIWSSSSCSPPPLVLRGSASVSLSALCSSPRRWLR